MPQPVNRRDFFKSLLLSSVVATLTPTELVAIEKRCDDTPASFRHCQFESFKIEAEYEEITDGEGFVRAIAYFQDRFYGMTKERGILPGDLIECGCRRFSKKVLVTKVSPIKLEGGSLEFEIHGYAPT